MSDPKELYEKLLTSSSGKVFAADALLRLAQDACRRYPKAKEAEKAVKTALHQMTGMFVSDSEVKRGHKLLCDPDLAGRELSLALLGLHASSRERLETLEALYHAIFSAVGEVHSILDIGCGLNPIALPFMGCGEEVSYHACDVNLKTIELVNAYFTRIGRQPTAFGYDILSGGPLPRADLCYLFKVLPLLEQQEKGGAARFLANLDATHIAVTFPLRTLSGRNVGMENFYREHYLPILQEACSHLTETIVGDEWLCILSR